MNEPNNPISPKHYSGPKGVECRDILMHVLKDSPFPDGYVAHCWATAFTYLFRCGRKGDWKEDMQKAIRFLEFAIQFGPAQELLDMVDGKKPFPEYASSLRVGARVRIIQESSSYHKQYGEVTKVHPEGSLKFQVTLHSGAETCFNPRELELLPETEVKA